MSTVQNEYHSMSANDNNVDTRAAIPLTHLSNSNNTIYAISDLHAEFYHDINVLYRKLDDLPIAKFLILAGDICDPIRYKHQYIDLLKYFRSKYQHVILIAGNHEYYGCVKQRNKVLIELQDICNISNAVLLNRSNVVIDGVRFIGATLWSLIDKYAFNLMNDSNYVFNDIFEYIESFILDFTYIKTQLTENTPNKEPIVVVTHHIPTSKLIHKRYKNNPINSGFSTDLLDVLTLQGVKYWFCGHTHEYSDIKYGDTKLIVNPMGYPSEIKNTDISYNLYTL